jgi:hypothetical protein
VQLFIRQSQGLVSTLSAHRISLVTPGWRTPLATLKDDGGLWLQYGANRFGERGFFEARRLIPRVRKLRMRPRKRIALHKIRYHLRTVQRHACTPDTAE